MQENESIQDKLKALGVQIGAKQVSPAPKPPKYRIEDVIPANEETTPFGSVLAYQEKYPGEYRHGNVPLNGVDQYRLIARWADAEPELATNAQSLLFLDTETTGISRATGTFAFMIGLGRFQPGGFELKQLIMSDPSQEAAMLAALARVTEGCTTIVTYNGKSFDLPLLEGRHILHRLPSPFAEKQHIDLLHLARKLWRNRLASRRLGDLETHILAFTRTKDDIPGWLVPEIYKEYLHSGDARPLAGVFYHNAIDILSLAGVFVHINSLLQHPISGRVLDLDLVAIGNLFEDMGSYEAAKDIYQTCLNKDLPPQIFTQTIRRYAAIQKKAGDWENAVALWQLGAQQDIDSCLELAKYYEHHAKQIDQALRWTEKALQLNERSRGLAYSFTKVELEHRLNRLKGRRLKTGTGKDS